MLLKVGFYILLLLVCTTIMAQDGKEDLLPFTTQNGLTNSDVTDIVQDNDGFLWIATADGLNRFDGTEVVQFLQDTTSNSIPSNYVSCLQLLPGNLLAIGRLPWLVSTNQRQFEMHPLRKKFAIPGSFVNRTRAAVFTKVFLLTFVNKRVIDNFCN